MFIPIGHACHPAGNLKALGLRTESLPFDWLLITPPFSFRYVNDLINTGFCKFTKDLAYNHRQKVVSLNYDYVEFFHHDLINNTNYNRPEDNNKDLVKTMNKRAERFMELITNKENKIVFLCMIKYKDLFLNDDIIDKLYDDMLEFDNNINIKCNFKVLLYLLNDDTDYELKIPTKFLTLRHFIFEKYIRNRKVSSIYGCKKDFVIMLKKHKLY